MVDKLQHNDPEAAVVWVGQVQNVGTREAVCHDVFDMWLRKDYAAAAQALQKADVPEETKAQWLEEAKPTVDSSAGK